MSASNVFTGALSDLDSLDPDQPIPDDERRDCRSYAEHYHTYALVLEGAGDAKTAAGYRFLAQITSIAESFNSPQHPFSPVFQGPEGRSLLPVDLGPNDLDAIAVLAKKTKDAGLASRLWDFLWERRRDPAACGAAAEHYLACAKSLDNADDWFRAVSKFTRALHLSSRLGREKPLYRSVSAAITAAAHDRSIDPHSFRAHHLLSILLRGRTGNPPDFAALCATIASECEAAGALRQAQDYREMEADWRRVIPDPTGEKAARIAAGEVAVRIAEARMADNRGSALAAASLLVDAIEMLRKAGAAKVRIDELRQRLAELQTASLAEMQTHSFQIDISEEVKAARAHVSGRPFPGAVMRLALAFPPTDVAQLEREVRESIQKHPLSHMMDAGLMDGKGRTIAHEKGVFGKAAGDEKEILEAKMFSHASKFRWGPRVQSFIEPARLQILVEHHPTVDHIGTIVHNNPFVPPDHEMIFARGLLAGFDGDFLIAIHLLVPQVENAIRHVLESRGVDTSNLQSDKTQPAKLLGSLLGMAETKAAFGEGLSFDLRGYLIEKSGFDFRNRVAHGFVDDDECFGRAAIATWWLVLHICVFFALTGGADRKNGQV